MRPVDKGNCPQKDDVDVVFNTYQEARGALIERLGEYCSFCEMHEDGPLAVEHKLPKSVARYKSLEKSWINFLLACVYCNSIKGHDDINEDDLLWPDTHNTFYALQYGPGALVKPNPELSTEEKRKAQRLIDLVGLNRLPGNLKIVSDRRWQNRQKAWDIATRLRTNLQKSDTPELRESIAWNAQSNGYFSIWMTVFKEDPDMLQRIIEKFPGTASVCFVSGSCVLCISR